jgi:hypothetical protein
MLKITVRLFLYLILVFCFSCEEQGLIVNCKDCTEEEPEKTFLEVKKDKDYSGNLILINVYEGNLEDSILYTSQISTFINSSISVTINKKYTVTGTYLINGNNYIVVDSATPRVKYNKDECDEPCYYVYDKVIDLRLKYTK